jgi:hypothetical protein
MFNMKKPCKDCPFRKDGTMLKSLGEKRVGGILEGVVNGDDFFSCHKTVDYDNEDHKLTEKNNFCAGALIAIDKADATYRNRNTRIAVMMGIYNPEEMQDKESVIEPKDYLGGKVNE